ncbi:hypothetical protein B0T20DRAFT_207931 [Sordaria brevicollis]|uniref:Uncharacterized protein n=1 Tax=Sordaria brevicollis TaxID=83679 RepID=A0AAE0PEJ3_SORBR|nr:hypothetical protein B0T20DRAFT_207931 [Sordaria brevicollis]
MVLVGQFLGLAPLIDAVPSPNHQQLDAIDDLPLLCPGPGETGTIFGDKVRQWRWPSRVRGQINVEWPFSCTSISLAVLGMGSRVLFLLGFCWVGWCPSLTATEYVLSVRDSAEGGSRDVGMPACGYGRRLYPYLQLEACDFPVDRIRLKAALAVHLEVLTSGTEMRLHTERVGAVDHAAKPFPLHAILISADTRDTTCLKRNHGGFLPGMPISKKRVIGSVWSCSLPSPLDKALPIGRLKHTCAPCGAASTTTIPRC